MGPVTRLTAVFLLGMAPGLAQSDQHIYTDSRESGWQDWSWAAVDFNHATTVHSGSRAIQVDADGHQALYLHHAAQDADQFTDLLFWIHGGSGGGQHLQVQGTLSEVAQPGVQLPVLAPGIWTEIRLPLAGLGVTGAADFDGFWIQNLSGATQPSFYLDDISLIASPAETNLNLAIKVDAALNPRPISPMIYGVAFASSGQLDELNAPLNRSGGNATTRYNWKLNASNRAGDWYFQSISDGSSTPGAGGDRHVQTSRDGGAEPILTVPMIEWMPKLGPGRTKLASYSIEKYGPQADNDWQWFPDAGNGITDPDGIAITWNDPTDANQLTDSTFQQQWIEHLTNRWGAAARGGVRFYCMDNEHTLWHSTHQDVHPLGATMQEIFGKWVDFGTKIKAVDPGALLLGPEEWGWPGWLYSGFDWQWAQSNGWPAVSTYPDRALNGGMDYAPWLLDQFRRYELDTGRRLLDVFTLHIYPQNGEHGNDVTEAMQRMRNRSTRALWDPTFVDPSWINTMIRMIPRMHEWVDAYYPDTPIGITEYNWGAEHHINGATAQADIFGIFGREGVDYATRWTTPATGTPTFNAMKMYRNYDEAKSTFGDISVSATGTDPDQVSTFAALRSADGALTLMVINKHLTATATTTVSLTNVSHRGVAELWQLTGANVITRLDDVTFSDDSVPARLPAQSITLFVITAGSTPVLRDLEVVSDGLCRFWLDGDVGREYVIEASHNLRDWQPVQTHTLTAPSVRIAVPIAVGDPNHYFRAHKSP